MRRHAFLVWVIAMLVAGCSRPSSPAGPYKPPPSATITLFPAKVAGGRTLTIAAATDVSFSRPFILEFQRSHPDLTVRYVDIISSALFEHARKACEKSSPTADLYLSVATNTLVQLANNGCARQLRGSLVSQIPDWAQWRREVVAFAIEEAVFVYNRNTISDGQAPRDHLKLVAMLRPDPLRWRGRIGTYDITVSEMGYLYANADARHSATYGRLIESFGRSEIRTYCCSNEMAAAVARGDIDFAYNVQMSYALAAQRRHPQLGIVVPSDYQAIQARSFMVPSGASNPVDSVRFATFLVSSRGQEIASRQSAPLNRTPGRPAATVARTQSMISIGPAMLALGDESRRRNFITEWTRATGTDDLF